MLLVYIILVEPEADHDKSGVIDNVLDSTTEKDWVLIW